MEYFTEENENDELHKVHYELLLSNIYAQNRKERPELRGQLRRVFVSPDNIKDFIENDNYLVKYDPLSDTPELYIEISKINILDDNSLMKFINNYGIPYHQQFTISKSGIYPTSLFERNESEKLLIGMDSMLFYEDLVKFKEAFLIWRNIKENNYNSFQEIKETLENHANFYEKYELEFTKQLPQEEFAKMVFASLGFTYGGEIVEVLENYKNDSDMIKHLANRASDVKILWEEVKNKDDKTIATAFLNLTLKKLKSGKTSTKFIDGKIVPAISFNNLMEVANYQLKQAIFKDSMLERCLNCDALFEPKHASQKFCSPLPNRKRSTCENTYNTRLKRQRRKEKQKLK